ncbi:MAG: MBL fold metallo-hydrolase, partial [Thermomicrobium sp.]|nr:MBL fold metallo-hydrolase [Thermomicrobium sp.]
MNAAMLTVGTYTVIPLVDVEGAFFPIEVVFPNVPLTAWERYRTRYADTFAASSLLYTRVTCYLLRGHGRTILVDAGVGPGPAPLFGHARGALLERLRDQGLRPEDIDTVVLTHLHPDHIGWAAVDGQPTFPRARYVISRTDVDTFHREDVRSAMHAIVPGYLDACLSPL